jgi:FtsP/CotA-like multicopper oxidase with cupredoxin domain
MIKKTLLFLCMLLFCTQIIAQDSSSKAVVLKVKEKEIIVDGRKATIYDIEGAKGLIFYEGSLFDIIVENHLKKPTGIHWHGMLLPNNQDGVPYVTQLPISPGEKYSYSYRIKQSGTYWMHAHYGLQEQKLLSAPLIIYDRSAQNPAVQEAVMFLSDFTFRDPYDIFKELRTKKASDRGSMQSMKTMDSKPDLNDVKYDAFLTNWKTLNDPDVIPTTPEKLVRLRIINGSSSSNFFISLGKLQGEVIAIDGSEIIPFSGNVFELAVAQRIDLLIKIPKENGVFPILAQGEGTNLQTGLILSAQPDHKLVIPQKSSITAGALTYNQEQKLKAKTPLAKKEINRRLVLNLDGNMAKYIWMLNERAWPNFKPLYVKEGERVELTFVNRTMMSHPMHLHGHFFQVTEIDGQPLNGALRDTLLVLPKSTVKVQFDANNPGNWALHCHNLYHLYAGMMTTLNYEDFKGPVFKIEPED